MRKFYEPCPCCGNQKERAPTLDELAIETIAEAVGVAIGKSWQTAVDWPGTTHVAVSIYNTLKRAGIEFSKAESTGSTGEPTL